MEIAAGERACYTLLAFICLKMEAHWQSNPIGKVRNNLPFFKNSTFLNFSQKTWLYQKIVSLFEITISP